MILPKLARSPLSAAGLALAMGLNAPATTLAQAPDENSASVRIEVSSFRNTRGTLNCRLFTEAPGFPEGEGARTVRAAISGIQATCMFNDLAPGTYAVAVVHDENGNGRMDKNFVGLPTEGYGVSNNRTYAASSPKWEESRFTVSAREPLALRVNLRY